jgi:hypothetical protein
MTQAFNLSQLANNVNSSGQLDATSGISGTLPTANLPTIPVTKGGTNLTTLTANNLLVGNGTSSVSFIAPSTSGNVLVSNGTSWTSSVFPTIGNSQSWTNVSSSRSVNVTYTNSSGKPIMVFIGLQNSNSQFCTFFVDGNASNIVYGNSYSWAYFYSIVPNGSTYGTSNNGTVTYWYELR